MDLAAFLDIPAVINLLDDHVYIVNSEDLAIASFHFRRNSDVMVSPKVFCEILMDIKAGMSALEACNKQGYTY